MYYQGVDSWLFDIIDQQQQQLLKQELTIILRVLVSPLGASKIKNDDKQITFIIIDAGYHNVQYALGRQ